MTGEDKQIIYRLLRTASQNVYGYTVPSFQNEEFKEDTSAAAGNTAIQRAPVQSSSVHQNTVPVQNPVSKPVSPVSVPTPKPVQAGGMSMGDIILKIARCTKCSLARTRANVVPGVGSRNPEVMVIGDAPSPDENNSGLSFMGAAGQLMDRMLAAIKLSRDSNCFLTNVVKCAAPQNRDPYPEETEACFGFIEAQIKCLKPKAILCAGRVAAVTLLKNNQNVNLSLPVDQLHGQFYEYNGIPVFVTWNPAEVLKNQDLKRPVWDDLKTFAAKLKEVSPSYASLFEQA